MDFCFTVVNSFIISGYALFVFPLSKITGFFKPEENVSQVAEPRNRPGDDGETPGAATVWRVNESILCLGAERRKRALTCDEMPACWSVPRA